MKKLIIFLVCTLMMSAAATWAKAPQVTEVSITGEGVGNGGRPVLVVTCAAKKAADVSDADLAVCAVRGVLFRGYADASKSSSFDSSTNHPALVGADNEAAHADYFADFFGSGAASTYVDILPDTRKVTKVGKVYHVSQMVQVNVPALRAKLEKDGIIRSLKTGW